MSAQCLHTSLLRPAVIHILRASGFHSARPSVIDTLTDLCARHLLLVASKTAEQVYDRSITIVHADHASSDQESFNGDPTEQNYLIPTITDVRLGLVAAAFFTSTTTASEEAWFESLRRPLGSFPAGAREKERRRRDLEDTRDVREFLDWATGPVNREIRRIAGVLAEAEEGFGMGAGETVASKDDFLVTLKKKHSKTGDGARYAGTALGKLADERGLLKIEGGPPSLIAWNEGVKRKRLEETVQDGIKQEDED